MPSLPEIEEAVLALSARDRAQLAVMLLTSLEEAAESPEAIEQLWIEECHRRFERFRQGRDAGIAAETVFTELRQRKP